MRLLRLQSNGAIHCTNNQVDSALPYAILSHTWNSEAVEVSSEDLRVNSEEIKAKIGYEKIRFRGQQAQKDGLDYFWVDTCCIDRASSAELSEAINSMFRWYQRASKCYVYLMDVSVNKDFLRDPQRAWEAALRKSRWFTRGRTLQELLAPQSVEFFSREHHRLGDKRSLEQIIHEVTRIPISALQGQDSSEFSVDERLSWASRRQTKRQEDKAYCLQGLFGIFLPPIYGEGEHAWHRLEKAIKERITAGEGHSLRSAAPIQEPRSFEDIWQALHKIDRSILTSLAFPEMHERRNNIETRHQRTCEWILTLDEYKSWVSSSQSLLWIKGKPGAGKSTLMAFLYEQLEEQLHKSHGINLYFFFTARGTELQRTHEGMLRSLLHQLYLQDPSIRPLVTDIFQRKKDALGSSESDPEWRQVELQNLLHQSLIRSARCQPVTVFVDALDEAGKQFAHVILEFFHTVNNHAATTNAKAKFCLSSRHYPIFNYSVSSLEVVVEQHNHQDISSFIYGKLRVSHVIEDDPTDEVDWKKLSTYIAKRAGGVFQWVCLTLPLIQKKINEGASPSEVHQILQSVPNELRDVYIHIIENMIDDDNRAQSFELFRWVCLAKRALTVAELCCALATREVDSGSSQISREQPFSGMTSDLRLKRRVRPLSGGLLEVVRAHENTEYVQVIHQSVKDFLLAGGLAVLACLKHDSNTKTQQLLQKHDMETLVLKCHATLYWSCLTYLSLDCVRIQVKAIGDETMLLGRDSARKLLQERLPFIVYASFNLLAHATEAEEYRSDNLRDELLLLHQIPSLWEDLKYVFGYLPCTEEKLLHIASQAKMTDMVEYILQTGDTINVINKYGDLHTALHIAVKHNAKDIVVALSQAGVDLNKPNTYGRTALMSAAAYDHVSIVEWLLERGAHRGLNTRGVISTLRAGARNGYMKLWSLVTGSSTDNIHEAETPVIALQNASEFGHTKVVNLLLDAGIEVDGTAHGRIALQAACLGGQEHIVKILLSRGADPNSKSDMKCGNPLFIASRNGRLGMVRLLLDHDANINFEGGVHGNALQAAALNGHTDVVKLLIRRGATVNSDNRSPMDTPLSAASGNGHEAVVRLLLEAGADVNAATGSFLATALQAASRYGHEAVVRLLLEVGADVNETGTTVSCGTALQAASYGGHETVVKILLEAGADVNACAAGIYGTALEDAASDGHITIVKMLLAKGADVNTYGREGTALHAASAKGDAAIVEVLLDTGANVNAYSRVHGTALKAALGRSNLNELSKRTVQLLRDHGAWSPNYWYERFPWIMEGQLDGGLGEGLDDELDEEFGNDWMIEVCLQRRP